MLDSKERTGTQDIIVRNALAQTNRRVKQKRKKTKWGHKSAVAVRSDSDRQHSAKQIKMVWTCR